MPLQSTRGGASAKGFGFTAGVKSPELDYLVVAGGGAGGFNMGGGGGAGGYRTSFPGGTAVIASYGVSIPITVGAGGTGSNTNPVSGTKGTASIFSTITAAGGGIGIGQCSGYSPFPNTDRNGGSGGGSGGQLGCYGIAAPGGIGNSPPVSPPQGNDGGRANINNEPSPGSGGRGGGGGGASTAGTNSFAQAAAGPGGAGATNLIAGNPAPTSIYAGGGGGGGTQYGGDQSGGTGGPGGGGPGGAINVGGTAGTANTGGGGGASGGSGPFGGSGGSGIVIIRAPGSASLSASPGTNTVTTLPAPAGGCKVANFTVPGNLTVS